jgi:CheY-like chemotaxis protein
MKVTDFPMLLVEDDPDEIVRVQDALAHGRLVNPLRIVSDGQKAIAYLSGQDEYVDRESHPFPSIVLLDLTLPELSGLKVLAWIRSQKTLKTLPVILLTSSTGVEGDLGPSDGPGVSYCLVKPVDSERLLQMMKSIGMYWMILDNSRPGAGPPGMSLQNRRVLVVDRDADFTRGIGEALRRRAPPIVVDPALDAADALRRLSNTPLDALVYERGIEEGEEFRFLSQVRAVKASLPVIVLCAEPDEPFAAQAIQRGMTGVLPKQVRQDLFSNDLHGLLMAAMTPGISVLGSVPEPRPARASTKAKLSRTRGKGRGSRRR